MATFKPVISYKRADGTYRVQIRIIHNRAKKVISTPIYISGTDLTRGGKIKNQAVNDQLDQIIATMRERCNEYGMALNEKTVEQVVEIATTDSKVFKLDFVAFCMQYVERLNSQERTGTASVYQRAITKFAKYLNRQEIDINEIDRQMVTGFVRFLECSMECGHIYFSRLKTMFQAAKNEYNDDDAGIIRIPKSPFNNITIQQKQTKKRKAITGEQFASIANYNVSSLQHWGDRLSCAEIARDLFLLSFYLIGMNLADLYEAAPAEKGCLVYYRKKTRNRRNDRAEMRVTIPPEAMQIIDKYKDTDGKRLLTFYHTNYHRLCNIVDNGINRINKDLQIKDLSFYSARHTWATWAVNECGIDKYTVHLALNHVDQKTAITDIYIEKDWRTTDKANRAVIDYSATFVKHLQTTGENISQQVKNSILHNNPGMSARQRK